MKDIPNKETLFNLLQWVSETFSEEISPFQAITDFGKQETTYHCWGCCGEFLSKWPRWEKPTLNTFLHTPNCKYVQLITIINEHKNEAKSIRVGR